MKKMIFLLGMLLPSAMVIAQELPMPSPNATLKQRVGLTDFTIEYSRPSMKGREIFGGLVPYDELWRTGANANTTIEVSSDIFFNGEKVPAGKYSLYTVPGKDEWVIILNRKNDHAGTSGYSEEEDLFRTKVESHDAQKTETFTIDINNIGAESADLVLRWAETEVRIPIKVEVNDLAMSNIKNALQGKDSENKWKVYRNAANYFYNNHIEMDKALDYVNQSIAAHGNSWYSYWLKAEILAEKKMYKEAIASAEKAKISGAAEAEASGTKFDYEKMIDDKINDWKGM